MRWGDMRPSDNVEDRTGMGSGGGGFPLGGGDAAGRRRDHPHRHRQPALRHQSAAVPGHDGRRRPGGRRRSRSPCPAGAARPRRAPPDPQKDFVRARRRRHRGRLDRSCSRQMGTRYEPPKLVLFSRLRRVDVRQGERRRRARSIAPPTRRSISTPRSSSELHSRFGAPGDFAAGLRDRARDRPSRAEPDGHDGQVRTSRGARGRAAAQRAHRCASSCRPIAMPACGASTRRSATCSNRATSRKACARRPPWATTRSRSARRATPCPTPSRTAKRSSAMRWFRTGFAVRRSAQLQHVCGEGPLTRDRGHFSCAGGARCPPGSARAARRDRIRLPPPSSLPRRGP